MEDKRPDPKPRKNAQLWQAYQWWFELMEMRKRHILRIDAIKKGKSNLDAQQEKDMLEVVQLDALLKLTKKRMTLAGITVGPIWNWLTGIKGLGEGGLAAQLIAQIDDIEKFDNPAKLWRFAGLAVVEGEAEKGTKNYSRKLKGTCFNIADQFIKQQTPVYVDIYYAEKERQRELHPEPFCIDCQAPATSKEKVDRKTGKPYLAYSCPNKQKKHRILYSPAHLSNRAWRKMIKVFLKDLYNKWKGKTDEQNQTTP